MAISSFPDQIFTPLRTAKSALRFGSVVLVSLLVTAWLATLYGAGEYGAVAYFSPVVPVIVAVALGGELLILRGSEKALLALLFLSMLILQLNFRERELGGGGLDPQNGIKVIFWVVMIGTALPFWRELVLLLRDSLTCRLALAFCAFAACSTLWSAEPSVTAASGVGLFAALIFSFVLALRASPIDVHRAYFWALAILIVIACGAYVVVPSIALLAPSEGESGYRLQGLAGHPNLLGQQSAILLLMAVAMWERRAVSRMWLIPVTIAGGAVLLFSQSRTSLAGVLVACAIVKLRELRLGKSILIGGLVVGTTIAFLGSADLMPDVFTRLSGLTRSGSTAEITTFTGRTELWQISWEWFLQKPLLGWGYNANERLMLDSVGANFAGNAVNSHNLVLQGLMTIGITGTMLVIGFVAGMARNMIVQPNALRDRIFIYLMVLGFAEAEFLTLPVITIYLGFWAIADAAVDSRGRQCRPSALGI